MNLMMNLKKIIFTLSILLSTQSFAGQMIQCASMENEWQRVVVNLNEEKSTLFLTTGVHLPDEQRFLFPIELDVIGNEYHQFEIKSNEIGQYLFIPSAVINKSLNPFHIYVGSKDLKSLSVEFKCFSSLY